LRGPTSNGRGGKGREKEGKGRLRGEEGKGKEKGGRR